MGSKPFALIFRSYLLRLIAVVGLLAAIPVWVGVGAVALPLVVCAAQLDISGPAGSVAFGTSVTVLSNGNFVVTDPDGPVSGVGAVYLYSPSGALISTLTGSSFNDHIGGGGVVVVGDDNFVVISGSWKNAGASNAGAVTWVNGRTGLSGLVSASNSLVGTKANDYVGVGLVGVGLIALSNGNYVVSSTRWNNGDALQAGAATWGNGNSGVTGPVSASNSLVGTTTNDQVGRYGVTPLSNGNYVVASPWNNGVANSHFGAATWGNGSTGVSGPVSASNSLIGTTNYDYVGYPGVTALSNGNYVVASSDWNNGVANSHFGAATWGNGSTGVTGPVSASNSLIGTTKYDQVGRFGVTPLSTGNYVVPSPNWNNGVPYSNFGAATWGNGSTGVTGPVSASNSLIGTTNYDNVGTYVAPLSNGNYVVASSNWNNSVPNSSFGAATWGNGNSGITGYVSASNSLVGTTTNDQVGFRFGVTPLSNGNYVVRSMRWNNGDALQAGAVTWGNGNSGVTGPVRANNSLVGTTTNDQVGSYVIPLSNGNYVVASSGWNNGAALQAGAATWGNGNSGVIGPVSASNSLIGTTADDLVGYSVRALSNGNYVVTSSVWNNGIALEAGAVTWGNGSTGVTGSVSASNSLIGTTAGDRVGGYGTIPLSDGNYVVGSPDWVDTFGAVTLANGAFRLTATIQPWNSVLGTTQGGGPRQTYAYDQTRQRLIVGQPASNIVSLFNMDQIFASDFEF